MSNNLKSTDFLLDREDQLEPEVYFSCVSFYLEQKKMSA
jgi:hypothetical protein